MMRKYVAYVVDSE